ncbi:hypothetical protein GCM10009665_01140 [Kitasatospora nipponensis]|uniref:Uncharacterized protein n=1 Tax=Kitasatospora nipponensis TaxID=258049 RepID=A0ABN1VKF4_9ACTN
MSERHRLVHPGSHPAGLDTVVVGPPNEQADHDAESAGGLRLPTFDEVVSRAAPAR